MKYASVMILSLLVKNNPVLLSLYGGPGSSTSTYDYAFTRKWSDIYTVVTWDQITLLGHSWGTYFGCSLVLEYPEYYECYIGTGQLVDFRQNEAAFQEAAARWAGDDEESRRLIEQLNAGDFTMEYYAARNALMEKYGYGLFAPESKSEEFSAILHEIAQREHQN